MGFPILVRWHLYIESGPNAHPPQTSSQMLDGRLYQRDYTSLFDYTVCTLAMVVNGLHFWGSPLWGRLRKDRRCTVTQWSLAARRCLLRIGPRYGRRALSVNRLRWLSMVCVGIRATVLVNSLHRSLGCLRRICQSFDGVVPWGSPLCGWFHVVLLGDVSTTELLCLSHWNAWRHLQLFSHQADLQHTFLCRR